MAGGAVIVQSTSDRPKPVTLPPLTGYVVLLTMLACIGGLLFGYDTGVVSSAMLYLPDSDAMQPLSTVWQELIVSITPGFAAIGALLAGKSSDIVGRRPIILTASVTFLIGAIICGVAPERITLLAGRTLLGLAIGFASMIIPVYISESAPCHMRGTLVTIYQMNIAAGFIVANAVAAIFAHINPENVGWRLMFGFAAIPAAIQTIGFIFVKDTPRFLYKSQKLSECKAVLEKIYGGAEEWVEYDMEEIKENTAEEELHRKGYENTPVIVRVFKTPHVLRAMILGCAMQMFQQLVGINTILYYTGTIIQSAGVKDKITTIWISCAISAVQTVATLMPMHFIEKMGRRPILMISIIGVTISLCLMGGAFLLINKESPDIDPSMVLKGLNKSENTKDVKFCAKFSNCDFCVTSPHCSFCHPVDDLTAGQCLPFLDNEDADESTVGYCSKLSANFSDYRLLPKYCPTKFTALPIVVMVIYLISFAFGMGPMPWVFNSEIYPLWARSTCVSLATFTNWVFNLIIALTFLSLGEAITKYGAFFLYAGFSVCAAIVFWFFVPETKGIEIEEVEKLFMTKIERRRTISDLQPHHLTLQDKHF